MEDHGRGPLTSARAPEAQAANPLDDRRSLRTFESIVDVTAFRWYLASMTGNWAALQMQQVVRGFLVYHLTGSYAALGSVALANSLPRLVLALYGGVVADRVAKRYVIQLGQAFNALMALTVGTLLLFDALRFEHLLVSAVLQGVSNSFTQPARQAMIPEIVGAKRLTNAIALNASGMNVMRLLAPAVGGVLLAFVGFEWVYFLMASLYLGAVVTMLRVPIATTAPTTLPQPERGRSPLPDILDALRYLRTQSTLTMLLGVHLFIVLFSQPYQRLLPGFVSDILADTEQETALRLGLLLTLTGVGALFGSLVVASMPDRNRGRLLLLGTAVLGSALLGFAFSEMFWLSAALAVGLGVGQASRQALSTVLIHTHVTNEYRGRVSSVMMMEMGLTSLGTFGFGILASVTGIQVALATAAAALLTVAVSVWIFVPSYRQID